MIELNAATPLYDYVDPDVIRSDLERLEECTSGLVVEAASSPASAFSQNVQAIFSLLDMPHVVSVYSQGYGAGYLSKSVLDFAEEHFAARDMYAEDLKAEWKSKQLKTVSHAFNLIPGLVDENESIRMALESQLAFATAAVWTALETLAKDTWVGAVNSFPDPLAKYALNSQAEEAMSNETKSIRANWLAKYGFDLRDCMGNVLAEDEAKFKFSTPGLIIKAFKTTFRGGSKEISQLWNGIGKDLNLLDLCRNLVAHRAGIVDDRFNRQTNLDLPLGVRLPLNTQNTYQFVGLVVRAGCELIASCEAYLQTIPD